MNAISRFQFYAILLFVCVLFFVLINLQSEINSLKGEKRKVDALIERYSSLIEARDDGGDRSNNIDAIVADSESETGALFASTRNDDDTVLIYNRVPKTGSTSFMGLAYDLCKENQFNVIHLNVSKNSHTLSLSDQSRFVSNVTN